MSGHNKWSKVKHKKAAADKEKSKVFGKLVRLIKLEARRSGGDENSPGLRAVLEKARAVNMPKDTIKRAIESAVSGSEELEEVVYEAYGPGGVAMVISALTDNRNRTGAEIKHLLSQHNIELAQPGAAAWAFTQEGAVWVPNQTITLNEEDAAKLDTVVMALDDHDDVQEVYTTHTS